MCPRCRKILARQFWLSSSGAAGAFIPNRLHLKKYIKSHSVRYWEPDRLFRFTIVFQLNNGKNIWSSLKMQWQLPHLTNDCIVWPWSAKQWKRSFLLRNYTQFLMETCQIEIKWILKEFVVFSLLVSDFRAVWWQKDSHLQLSPMTDFHNRIKKFGAGDFFGGRCGWESTNLFVIALMLLSKEEYARKRIHNGCSVRIENSVTQHNCSASLGKPCDAKQLPSSVFLFCLIWGRNRAPFPMP